MESFDPNNACAKCGHRGMKGWDDLTDDERLLAERLPASADFTPQQRKKHRFCIRCWYEVREASRSI